MLYNAEITKEVAADRDKLCEQLYIFLRHYINKRLIYQDYSAREDFVQDTIMFLLKRYNMLTDEEKNTINLEKFFFNRAYSFVGERLRRQSNAYTRAKKFREEVLYLEAIDKSSKEIEYIDDILLDSLISKYKLNKNKSALLKKLAINKLILLGYYGEVTKVNEDQGLNGTLNTLSFSVADEYLIKSIKEGANIYK